MDEEVCSQVKPRPASTCKIVCITYLLGACMPAGTMDEEVPPGEAYEHGELLMYKARILEEGGRALGTLSMPRVTAALHAGLQF
jgi:hypothetical protein